MTGPVNRENTEGGFAPRLHTSPNLQWKIYYWNIHFWKIHFWKYAFGKYTLHDGYMLLQPWSAMLLPQLVKYFNFSNHCAILQPKYVCLKIIWPAPPLKVFWKFILGRIQNIPFLQKMRQCLVNCYHNQDQSYSNRRNYRHHLCC